jgi:hypothetical protein
MTGRLPRFKVWLADEDQLGDLVLRAGSKERGPHDVDFAGTTPSEVAIVAYKRTRAVDSVSLSVPFIVKDFDKSKFYDVVVTPAGVSSCVERRSEDPDEDPDEPEPLSVTPEQLVRDETYKTWVPGPEDGAIIGEPLAARLGEREPWIVGAMRRVELRKTDKHVAYIDPDLESMRRGGSSRIAACSCGWRGPERATLELAYDDARQHEGS